MQDKLRSLAEFGRNYIAVLIGLMLLLVLAGCFYAIREASHYSHDNSLLSDPVNQTDGRSRAAQTSSTAAR